MRVKWLSQNPHIYTTHVKRMLQLTVFLGHRSNGQPVPTINNRTNFPSEHSVFDEPSIMVLISNSVRQQLEN